jgi:ATP-dependent DNA helicase RecG
MAGFWNQAVGENFEISGIVNPEKIEQDFLNTLNSEKFNTQINPVTKKYKLEGKTVLAFYIPVPNHKPVYYNTPANTFIRQGSADRKAHKAEIDAMFRDQSYGTKTTETIPDTSVDDLHKRSLARYRDYLTRFNPNSVYNELTDREFLKKTRVVNGNLTYAGLLMFGKRDAIDKVFVDFRIDLLEIPASSYSDAEPRYTFRLEEQENLWEYYFTLFDRIKNKIDVPFRMSDQGFAMGDSAPLQALREALVNMLMHTDYFSPAKPRVRIFTDQIEYFNQGGLPKPLKELLEYFNKTDNPPKKRQKVKNELVRRTKKGLANIVFK